MKIKINALFPFGPAVIATAGVFLVSFGLIAWAGGPENQIGKPKSNPDTIPVNKQKSTSKDLDRELCELDEAKERLGELKNTNWEKIHQQIEKAMKEIDLEKIHVQMAEAIKNVDMDKIGNEIEASLNKIDFNKIENDVEAAMNDVSKFDREKMKLEIKKMRIDVDNELKKKEWMNEVEEIKKINMKEVEEKMEDVKKEMEKVKDDLNMEKIDMKETMTNAYSQIEKAKTELKGHQEMIYALEKDGLLNTKQDYKIEYRNGELFIDGKKQSAEITNKYKRYFKENMTIEKQNNDLKIDTD